MANLNVPRTRELLQRFDFKALFIEELGWSRPPGAAAHQPDLFTAEGDTFRCQAIAQLAGVMVYEVTAGSGQIPDAGARAALHVEVEKRQFENLLIFVDGQRLQSLWYWVKREGSKKYPRSHYYSRTQPGDLFLSKLSGIVVDIGELDEAGNLPVTEVTSRLRRALDVERVTKRFYGEFQDLLIDFTDQIQGINSEHDRRWYASALLNRLMFVYFLQRKFYLDGGDADYVQHKLAQTKKGGKNQYYATFLKTLFFDGFAKPEEQRSPETRKLIGDIVYLNGGLFLPHPVEQRWPKIAIPDAAFDALFELFGRYSWNLNDTPGGDDNEINPDVLGFIFEKYINQKEFGAYYTRPEITEYLCEQTIHQLILDAVNTPADLRGLPTPAGFQTRHFDTVADLLMNLDADLCKLLLHDVLPKLSLLDPACGSGAFLVAAMKTLIAVYSAVIGRIKFLTDKALTQWLAKVEREHKNVGYFIKKSIITHNLFGVDIMHEAVEIARLRLFLALVASAQGANQLEPLPNIDFNILDGNSLIGLLRVDEAEFNRRANPELKQLGLGIRKPDPEQLGLGLSTTTKTFAQVVGERNRLLLSYRSAATYSKELQSIRDDINRHRAEAQRLLNEILLEDMQSLGVMVEQATWDDKKGQEGRPAKRAMRMADVEGLDPFHWGYEFDEVMNERGGFDAIITNPPWEIFKPQAKEFFSEYSDLVTRNKMTIKEFEKEQAKLLKDADVRKAWLAYRSRFPHVNQYWRTTPQFANQNTVVNGKRAGSDINLYKLFVEQCYNLLRPDGRCGIVIPSGIYTDLGAKQLREMLFNQTRVTGLFGFENREEIFEGVHRSFKFVVLTFEKGGATNSFPGAFMRHDVEELEHFPYQGALPISVELVRRLSPDTLSVMEFKTELDVQIAEKMLRFPLLGEHIEGMWTLVLSREFHMTDDRHLFKTLPGKGRLPLYEGKMIHQFEHQYAEPRYWVDENEGRQALLGKERDTGQRLDYQGYRLAYRAVAASTNERTMIAAILPPDVCAGHSLNASTGQRLASLDMLYLVASLNSFISDFSLRQRITANLTLFYIYQLPVPRLTSKDPAFRPIAERAAKLICTTPEFDDLAKQVGLGSHKNGVTDEAKRARLRAELDGMIAHLYGLTEEEFAHVLSTFPLVKQEVKDAAMVAYRGQEYVLHRAHSGFPGMNPRDMAHQFGEKFRADED